MKPEGTITRVVVVNMGGRKPASEISDRAKRYRAQKGVKGPKRCVICGAARSPGKRPLDVMHLDGDEANEDPRNLAYGCRSCNARLGAAFKKAGAGVRTVQYNPASVPTFQQYAWAVAHHVREAHDEGGAIIHATPRHKRIEYAQRIAETKRGRGTASGGRDEVPF